MAAPASLRSGHARAAADRARRRRRAVLAGVLRAGPLAAHGGRLRQPVAAGLSGARREQPRDGARVPRRVPAGGAAVGRAGRAAARGHDGAAHRDRSRAPAAATRWRAARGVRADLARLDLGAPARHRRHVRRRRRHVGARHARVAAGHRRSAPAGVRRPVGALDRAARRARVAFRPRMRSPAWCPRCFDGGRPVPSVAGLDAYLALLREAYAASPAAPVAAAAAARRGHAAVPRQPPTSGTVLPDTAEVYNVARHGRARPGPDGGRRAGLCAALRLEPASLAARQNLGQIRHEQGRALLEARRVPRRCGRAARAVAAAATVGRGAQRPRRRARLGERGGRRPRRSSAQPWRSIRISWRRGAICRRRKRWYEGPRRH